MDNILELIESKNYKELKKQIVELNEADIAEIIEDLEDKSEQLKVFRLLPKDMAADIFANISIDIQQSIITSLSTKEAGIIIDNLEADDAADLIEEMPANIVTKILSNTTPETRKDINYLLKYPVNSAGSIMNIDFFDLKENITIAEAITKIRKTGEEKETIDVCFVLDKSRKLLGSIELKDLLFNPPDELVKNIMNDNVPFSYTYEDQEEVASKFSKYDVNIMPVVDSENRLVGMVTSDDIIDVIEKEATEDIEKMAAISPSDKPYLRTGIFETYRKRIPWLLILMISATFTGKIIQHYESALAAYVVLTSFIPMLMDTGGNAGGQASATIIRGLSLNEIDYSDSFRVMFKELRVSFLIGLTLAFANFLKLLLVDHVGVSIAFVVCLSLIVTICFAKLIGSLLPIGAKKLGFDPAVMASPFITTLVDAISLFTYFNFATLILGI